jgi:hypothetical protein
MASWDDEPGECPRCAYPLDTEGYCGHCRENPRHPPPSFHYDERAFGPHVGAGELADEPVLPRLKRFEFERRFGGDATTDAEVGELVAAQLRELGATADAAGAAAEVVEALRTAGDVPVVVVEPTEWDRYAEQRAGASAEIRVRAGLHLGAGEAVRSFAVIASAVVALADDAGLPPAERLLRVRSELRRLARIWVRLRSVDRAVYEAVHELSRRLEVTDYDAARLTDPGALGRPGPRADDVVSHLAGTVGEADARDALAHLRDERLLRERRGRWTVAV